MAERVLVGAGVGSGVASGPAFVHLRAVEALAEISKPGARIGLIAIKKAMDAVALELESVQTAGEALEVMQALEMILRDPALFDAVKSHLSEGHDASRAIRGAFNQFARQLEALGGYFAARASDLGYLGNRVIDELSGRQDGPEFPTEPFILVTESLSPIDAAKLDPTRVLAVITAEGTPTSHSSIIIRAAQLPMVVGVVGAPVIRQGQQLLVDASSGQVFVDPTADRELQYAAAANPPTEALELAKHPQDNPLSIKLFANLGSSIESKVALQSGADGVGLFRTELLYLGRNEPPSFGEQVSEYAELLRQFGSQRVIVRVLDLDFDKPLPFLVQAGEGTYANRGLQVLLANPQVLETQLRALAEARTIAPMADLWVMAPMVLNVDDAATFAGMARRAGLEHVGIMVEVPEIAQPETIAQVLRYVDFLSIGTNDLTHYTLGLSRQNGLATLADTRKPEVLKLIRGVVEAAKTAGKPVGVCGEAASDPDTARQLIEMGVDSLSASPSLLPGLRLDLQT
jgi:phosphotransferase system enzyme I (PtsI)